MTMQTTLVSARQVGTTYDDHMMTVNSSVTRITELLHFKPKIFNN